MDVQGDVGARPPPTTSHIPLSKDKSLISSISI